MFSQTILALFIAGLPVGILSFLLARWAISKDLFSLDDKKENAKPKLTKEKVKESNNIVLKRWLAFGGGYYGIMALLTYAHVESLEIWQAFAKFESLSQFFSQISIGFFIGLVVQAIQNLITAFVWFIYWPKYLPIESGFIWLLLSYFGFIVGEKCAHNYSAIETWVKSKL